MDIQLHYAEKGSGEPLILLHGLMAKEPNIRPWADI